MKIAIITTDNREHCRDYSAAIPSFGAAPEALLQGFAALHEHEFHVIGCVREVVRSPAKIAGNIWFHSIKLTRFGMMRTLFLEAAFKIRHRLRQIQPDIVHGQGTEKECALSAVLSGFPNVVTIHGNMRELARLHNARPFSFGWLASHLENFALIRTAGVFCNSAYTESLVSPRARRTWRVANPIRERFLAPNILAPSNPVRHLLNIGVVTPRKRQLEILNLAKVLHESGAPICIDFVGEANRNHDYARNFLDLICDAEQAGYARYLGTRDLASLIEELDSADAFLHFPFEEAFGLVVAESLARGLKFFGSRLGGIIDICNGMSGAELYDADDWQGLAAGISRWAKTTPVRFPENQRLTKERYHPRTIAERHLEIYREVLGFPSPSGSAV